MDASSKNSAPNGHMNIAGIELVTFSLSCSKFPLKTRQICFRNATAQKNNKLDENKFYFLARTMSMGHVKEVHSCTCSILKPASINKSRT